MPARKLRVFLDRNNVKYWTIHHGSAYTAQEVAALSHVPGRELAKTVVIKVHDDMAMAVLPASEHVDFPRLRKALGTDDVSLATEAEFKDRFPDCDLGAMPPFGNLYGMKVAVAGSLERNAQIAFNAGTHSELISLRYDDYKRLVNPQVVDFATVH